MPNYYHLRKSLFEAMLEKREIEISHEKLVNFILLEQ
jgi:hypothetical protein